MPAFRNFHVKPEHVGQTLSAVLREFVPGKSWADVKKLLHDRHVQVNGNLSTDERRRVRAGDVIKLWQHPQAKPPDAADVKIVYLDRDLVVVDKPAGMTTLRHAEEADWSAERKSRQPTLDDLLPQAIARHPMWRSLSQAKPAGPTTPVAPQPTIKAHPLFRDAGKSVQKTPNRPVFQVKNQGKKLDPSRGRPGGRPVTGRPGHVRPTHATRDQPVPLPDVRPVHRLDRDTSGLMVFALSLVAETELVALFKAHNITRSYLAVAHGVVEAQTIANYLVRDRGDGRRGSTPRGKDAPDAQHAVTHVKPLEVIGVQYTLIECTLETGRTHQIRIHMAEQGHMLAGERTYHVAPNGAATKDTSGAPRQVLHAHELGFVHPVTGKKMHFKSPFPPDLQAWLERLRKSI